MSNINQVDNSEYACRNCTHNNAIEYKWKNLYLELLINLLSSLLSLESALHISYFQLGSIDCFRFSF